MVELKLGTLHVKVLNTRAYVYHAANVSLRFFDFGSFVDKAY